MSLFHCFKTNKQTLKDIHVKETGMFLLILPMSLKHGCKIQNPFQLSASVETKPRAMINAESKALSWIFSFVPDAKRFSMSAILIINPTRTGEGSSTGKIK
jgi:hypothetical protein